MWFHGQRRVQDLFSPGADSIFRWQKYFHQGHNHEGLAPKKILPLGQNRQDGG